MSYEATLSGCNINASYSRHHSLGMGGGSLGFAGSVACFCTALLKAYCEEIRHNNDQMVFFYYSQPTSIGNVYLSLHPPKLRLFSTVHLTVDDQDIGKTSDVASLHLKSAECTISTHGTKARVAAAFERWGDSLWADTSHSFHTMPGCSAPDRCSSSGSRQSHTPLLCLMNKRILKIIS